MCSRVRCIGLFYFFSNGALQPRFNSKRLPAFLHSSHIVCFPGLFFDCQKFTLSTSLYIYAPMTAMDLRELLLLCAVALLIDRIPALLQTFCDGSRADTVSWINLEVEETIVRRRHTRKCDTAEYEMRERMTSTGEAMELDSAVARFSQLAENRG